MNVGAKLPAKRLLVEHLTEKEWNMVEDKFRFYAFTTYYKRTYRDEHDLLLRFVKSLIASTDPILDKQQVLDWYLRRRRTTRLTVEGGSS